MIDKELEQYYDNYRTMFMDAGWKQLQQDLMQNATVINSVEACKDGNDLYFRKAVSYTHLTLPTKRIV